LIKALFFDLDGTLLTSTGRISEKTKEALKACSKIGIKTFTATGRAPLLLKMLDLDADEQEIIKDGGVFYNGGCVRLNDTSIYTFLSDEIVMRCIEAIMPYKEVNVLVQMENENHSFRYGLKDEEYTGWGVEKNELVIFEKCNFTRVVKIGLYLPNCLLQEVIDKLQALLGTEVNVYIYSGNNYKLIDVVDRKANKMLGIKRTAQIYGWNDDEIAVFGDDYNDIEMLKGFKYSFAMGNACDEVKSYANHVTLSNDKEGIYHALSAILQII